MSPLDSELPNVFTDPIWYDLSGCICQSGEGDQVPHRTSSNQILGRRQPTKSGQHAHFGLTQEGKSKNPKNLRAALPSCTGMQCTSRIVLHSRATSGDVATPGTSRVQCTHFPWMYVHLGRLVFRWARCTQRGLQSCETGSVPIQTT